MSQTVDDRNDSSFVVSVSQNNQIPTHELSGDENASKSVLLSDIQTQKSNFFLAVMTIMKTVIGVGILGLPYVLSQLGWALGLIIFTLTAVTNHYACVLLLKCKNLSHKSNLSTIGYSILESKIFLGFLYFIVIFNNFGVCIAELTIFKQILQQIFDKLLISENKIDGNAWYIQSWFTIGIVLAIGLIPFVLLRKIQKLRFLALTGIFAITLFIISVIINFFDVMIKRDWGLPPAGISAWPNPDRPFATIASIPNLLLAMLYQMNFFPIYKGMKNSSDQKMKNASLVGTAACYGIYMMFGLLGYFTYGNQLKSNFLLSLDPKTTDLALYLITNSIFLISVLCSFPIIFFGARNNFVALIKLFKSTAQQQLISKEKQSLEDVSQYVVTQNKQRKKQQANIIYYIITVILFAGIFSIAVTVGQLGTIFNLVGAISANSIGFILPSFFYLGLIIKLKKSKKYNFYLALVLFVVSAPFGIFSVVAQFFKEPVPASSIPGL